jgi:predicted DNA-binding transcriptional regulator AlpA
MEDSMTVNANDRLRAKQAAEFLDVSPSTLAKWRMNGAGPRYHRCGPRIVYYLPHELDTWLAECDREIKPPQMKPL